MKMCPRGSGGKRLKMSALSDERGGFETAATYNKYMVLRNLAAVLLLVPILAEAAIPLGPASPVTPRIPTVAAGWQEGASIATSGRETLVAWRDETSGREGIYVAQLSLDGAVVPGKLRRIPELTTWVSFAWTGQAYVVVWLSERFTIRATTMDGELRTLVPPRTVHMDGSALSNIAWLGDRGAIAAGRVLLFLDGNGSVVNVADIDPGASPFEDERIVASHDTFCLFTQATPQESILFGRRYTTAGVPLDPEPVHIATGPRIAEDWDVAFDGEQWALIAVDSDPDAPRVRRFLVDPATMQSRALEPIAIAGAASGAHVEPAGDGFVALWLERDRRTSTLTMLPFTEDADSNIVRGATHHGIAYDLEEISNGTTLTVAYTVEPPGRLSRDIHTEKVDWHSGGTLQAGPASFSMQWQSVAAGAAHGRTSLLAWLEGEPSTDAMRVLIARTNGGVVDGPIVTLSETAYAVRPQVVATGAMHLVLWLEPGDGPYPYLVMQRVGLDGVQLDDTPSILAAGVSVAAASNGRYVLVVWAGPGGLYAGRLSAYGSVVDAVPLLLDARPAAPPALASNGSDFLVVWPEGSDSQFPTPDRLDLHAARVTDAGIAEPSFPVAIGPANQRDMVIGSDGRDYVVAYREMEGDGHGPIVTKKLLAAGALEDTTADAPGTFVAEVIDSFRTPTIATTRDGSILAWEEFRWFSLEAKLRMARLDGEGAPVEAPVTLAHSGVLGMTPFAFVAGGHTGALLYSVLEDDDVYGPSMRLMLRTFGETQPRRRSARR